MDDFFELAAKRESCRNYSTDRPVEAEKLQKMVATARLAPSACNSQPWHFTIVHSAERAAAVARTLQSMNLNRFASLCPAFIVINEEKANLLSTVGNVVKSQHYAGFDIGLATAHLCFAATELGLSTCIIGWFDADALKKAARIPADRTISLVLAVGYAQDDKIRAKVRKPLDEIMTII
jgi:nitroreductase